MLNMRVLILILGKVTASCLNVRCGPGISYNRVGKLYKGDYVDVFAKVGSWYIIKTDDDLVGAVSSDYLEAVYDESERYSTSVETEETTEEVTETVSKDVNSVENTETEEVLETEETSNEAVVSEEFANSEELTEEEQEFLDLINANRETNGLEPLQIDGEVQNVARLKADDLVNNNYFSHDSETYGDIQNMLNTFGVTYISAGENIAGNSSLAKAVEAWMNSENHKINILSESYNYTGVAIAESETYGKIFVQVFVQK